MVFYYFVDKEGVRQGPLPIEDLQSNDIEPNTLVWCKGMKKWCKAKDVDELNSIFKSSDLASNPSSFEKVDNTPIVEESSNSISNPNLLGTPKQQKSELPQQHIPIEMHPTELELASWNWGAFFFNWIWGIFNGAYWTLAFILVLFIPYIGGLCFGEDIFTLVSREQDLLGLQKNGVVGSLLKPLNADGQLQVGYMFCIFHLCNCITMINILDDSLY